MNLGERVVIGGRTMLRPGFSLVGLEGNVVSSRADAPAGTVAVWVDWEGANYSDQEIEELPRVVNVDSRYLDPVGTPEPQPAHQPAPLHAVPNVPKENNDDDDTPRPSLRLV